MLFRFAIAESVLQGMNLGYRRMGLQAAINVVGGVAVVGALWVGLGLEGLGAARGVEAVAAMLCFWWLTRRFVRWFGVARPSREEVRTLLGMSLWLAAGDLIAKILLASDVIILGAIIAPAAVTVYVLTGYAARAAGSIHLLTATATVPGFGGVLGRGDLLRTARARRELLTLTWVFVTVAGATILAWNPAFLSLWVGPGRHAGPVVDVLIVLIAAQTAFIRVDSYLIDASLRPRDRVRVGALAAVVMIGTTIPLTHSYGMLGLCLGVLAGRGVQSVGYPWLVGRILGSARRPETMGGSALRLGVTGVVVLSGAVAFGTRVAVENWVAWIAGVGITAPAVAAVALYAGLPAAERHHLLGRVKALVSDRWRG